MRSVVISSGHAKHVRGAVGYIDEVDEARRVVDQVFSILRHHGADVKKFHDDTSKTVNANLSTIVNYHNSQSRDLDVSVHFNAYSTTTKPMGVEVLYVTQNHLAGMVSTEIAITGKFINRGAKKRSDLYFLNNTKKPAILIETCFCDSKEDVDLYHRHFEPLCECIADAIGDLQLGAQIPVPPLQPVPEPQPQPPADFDWVRDIETTVFGGKGDPNNSAYVPYAPITDEMFGAAVPWKFPDQRPQILVRNIATGKYVVVDIVDLGPWMIDDCYWAIEQRPIAEQCCEAGKPLPSGPNAGKVPSNKAGLDLTPAAARAIGLSGKGVCDWVLLE